MASLKECMKRLGIEGESASFLEQSVTDILAASPEDQRNEHKAVLNVIGGLSIDRRNVLQQVYEALDDDGRTQVFETVKRTKLAQQAADAVPLAQEIAQGAGAQTQKKPGWGTEALNTVFDAAGDSRQFLQDTEKDWATTGGTTGLGPIPRLGATVVGQLANIPALVEQIGGLAGYGTNEEGQQEDASFGKTGEAVLGLVGGIGSMGLNLPMQAQKFSNDLLADMGVSRETIEQINKYSGSNLLVGGSDSPLPSSFGAAPLANFWSDLFDGPNNSVTDDQFIERIREDVATRPSQVLDIPASFVGIKTVKGAFLGARKILGGRAAKAAAATEGAAQAAKMTEAVELSRQDIEALKAERAAKQEVAVSDDFVPDEMRQYEKAAADGAAEAKLETSDVSSNLARAEAVADTKKRIDGTEPMYAVADDGSLIQVGVPTKLKDGIKPNKTSRSYMGKLTKNLKNPVVAVLGVYGAANLIDALTNDEPDVFSGEAALNTAMLGAIAMAPSRHVTKARTAIGKRMDDLRNISRNFVLDNGKLDVVPFSGMMRQLKDAAGDTQMLKYRNAVEEFELTVHQAYGDLHSDLGRTRRATEDFLGGLGLTHQEWLAADKRVPEVGLTRRLKDDAATWLEMSDGQARDISDLTPKELALYQYATGLFENGKQQLDQMTQSTGAKDINTAKDYWTLFSSSDLRAAIDLPKSIYRNKESTFTDAYFAFRTTKGVPHKLTLSYKETLERYVTQQKHYTYMSPVVRKAAELYDAMAKDGVFKNNAALATRFERWINDTAGFTDDGMKPGTRKFIQWFTRNNSIAQLGFNAGSIVAQFTSYPFVVNAIGSRYALRGITEMMNEMVKHRGDPTKSLAFQKSNVLRGRTAETGLGEAFKIVEPGRITPEKIRDFSLKFMRGADLLVARGTWYGGYRSALAKGMGDVRAIKFADDLVLKTQGDASSIFAPAIQRRQLGRTLTQFATFSFSNFDYLKGEAFKVGQNTLHGNMSKGRAYGAMLEGAIASYLITQIYKELWNVESRQFDPISAYQEKGTEGVFKNLVDQIPFAANKGYGGGFLDGPLLGRGGGALDIFRTVAKGEAPDMSDVLKASGPVAGALGIPTITIDRMMRQGGNPFPLRRESEGSTPPKRKATRRPKRRRTRD